MRPLGRQGSARGTSLARLDRDARGRANEEESSMARIQRSLSSLPLIAALALGFSAAAWSEEEEPSRGAEIKFVDLGGIRDWRAEGNRALDIQSARGEWYRATFATPCDGLQFRDSIAFVTSGPNVLDRFGSVLVRGDRCWFETFERLPGEPDEAAPRD
jgi:hypothetical protein